MVTAIIIRSGKVFATQCGYVDFKDGWEFPSGKVEPDEMPQEALVREIIKKNSSDCINNQELLSFL